MRTVFLLFAGLLFVLQLAAQGIPEGAQKDSAVAGRTLSGFRKMTAAPSIRPFFLTEAGRQGLFIYDPADRNTPDDSVMTLVAPGGLRFKRSMDNPLINVKWFGTKGDGGADDWYPIQKAIDYILNNGQAGKTLYFPAGTYAITKPLIIARLSGGQYKQASITLAGPANSKNISDGFACIAPVFNNTFAIGIQLGKGVVIKDLMIKGRFTFPNSLNQIQVDTLSFNQWTDGVSRENRYSPYGGIVIDPFSDAKAYQKQEDMYPGLQRYYLPGLGRAGSTAIQVIGCSIRNFIVGVMITPSNQQNGELIDVIDCDISGNKVAYAMSQAQSKECHVQRLKCWQPTHTVFDNGHFGFRHGDGAAVPMVDGVNIAGYVKQLCSIYAPSFNGSFRNVYAEGLYRLGFVGGPATVVFEDCQIDFGTQDPGIPYPDFYVLGSGVTFQNCLLRLYPGVPGARLVLSATNNRYEGGVMNAPPVAVNLGNSGTYPHPSFHNIQMYYSGGILGSSNHGDVSSDFPLQGSNGPAPDPVYYGNTYFYRNPFYGADVFYRLTYQDSYERTVRISGSPIVHTDKSNWTAWFKLTSLSDTCLLRKGDFILTTGLPYQDDLNAITAVTYPVGIIREITHDTVRLDNLAQGIPQAKALNLWADYFVNAQELMTGDLAAGSNTIVKVQGRFPAIGERLDIPMLASGTFVTGVNRQARTISFSTSNTTGKSFADQTFFNGSPSVEMFSSYDLPSLQQLGKTLVGGADFYKFDAEAVNTQKQDFPGKGTWSSHYKIFHTNPRGDTSLHTFSYAPVSYRADGDNASSPSGDGEAPAVISTGPGVVVKVEGNDVNMQVLVTTKVPVTGNIVRLRLGRPKKRSVIPVISSGDSFSANNSERLFCNAVNPSELIIGGHLLAPGTYVFNVHAAR